MTVRGIAVTYEAFSVDSNVMAAIGRAVCARALAGSDQSVVLCPVDRGPAEVIEIARKAGIEFMTIEDFVASLQAEGESTPEE